MEEPAPCVNPGLRHPYLQHGKAERKASLMICCFRYETVTYYCIELRRYFSLYASRGRPDRALAHSSDDGWQA